MYKQHADSGTQCQTSTANVCTGVEVTRSRGMCTSSEDSHQRRIQLLGAALPCWLEGCTPRFRPPRPPPPPWSESSWGSGMFKTQLSLLSRCPSCYLVMITVRRASLSMPKSCKVHHDTSMVDSAQADFKKAPTHRHAQKYLKGAIADIFAIQQDALDVAHTWHWQNTSEVCKSNMRSSKTCAKSTADRICHCVERRD